MTLVIFPSAKNVSKDLQGIGQMPAIIYPIDQMRMIDLFSQYYLDEANLSAQFNIVTYESYEQVVRKVDGRENVRVTRLDRLRDLGYTIWYGMKDFDFAMVDTLIINFADVAELSVLESPIEDRCYYAIEDVSSKWTYFDQENGEIMRYYDKPENTDGITTNNMLIGIFHIAHPLEFKRILETSLYIDRGIDSFWMAIQDYSRIYPYKMVCTDAWFDVGHIDKYFDTQIAIKSRTFNHITIDKNRGILTKTSDDKEKFIDEIQWYLKLPTDVEYARPRIFSYSLNYNNPYVSMEYYAYHTLHELFLFGDLTSEQWKNVFRRIRFILNDFKRYSVKDDGVRESVKAIYIDKTVERLKSMEGTEGFPDFESILIINSVQYLSLKEICDLLPIIIEEELLDIDEFNIIHGDLCFSNIMIDSNYSFVKLIDPRGKFGKYDIYGDRRYELAKLMHSIDGKYDFIIKDKFLLSEENGLSYEIAYDQGIDIMGCFLDIFAEEMAKDYRKIKLIESLLFFSMIPLHSESRSQQKVMLGTAISLLAEVKNIRRD